MPSPMTRPSSDSTRIGTSRFPFASRTASDTLRGSGYFFLIWRVTVVLWRRLPLVPVMVRVLLPVLLLRLVWMVKVAVLVVLEGLKVAVVVVGSPLRLRATVPMKPPLGLIAIV